MVRTLLRKLLHRYAQVGPDGEAVHRPAIQMGLVDDLVLLENRLRPSTPFRRESLVGFCATRQQPTPKPIRLIALSRASATHPARAKLSGSAAPSISSVETMLGCAANPASRPFPLARNRSTYRPPKQYPTAPIFLTPYSSRRALIVFAMTGSMTSVPCLAIHGGKAEALSSSRPRWHGVAVEEVGRHDEAAGGGYTVRSSC